MNILIASDSFKESLSAQQVGACIEAGFKQVFAKANYRNMPLADGGEGMANILCSAQDGVLKTSMVQDPLANLIQAEWGLIDDGKTAVIEIASASGLALVHPNERNPAITSTYGTGQLMLEALEMGVDTIVMGLGGSATNDGGAGILQALGGRLLGESGNEIAHGGLALQALHSIDLSGLHPRCSDIELIIASDVSNPLCGEQGASAVFAPQKGADAKMISELDASLAHFADLAYALSGVARHDSPMYGAAGGALLGISLAFSVEVNYGIDVVLDIVQADKAIAWADLIITGEGQMDNQTLQGKVPAGLAKRAKTQQTPIIAIVGSLGQEVDELYPLITAVFDSVRAPQSLETVLKEAEYNITQTARNVAMMLKLGMCL